MTLADGVLAKRAVTAINSFNYEAFNAQQAALLDAVEENRRKIQQRAGKEKAARRRKATKLNKEYEMLMLEWMWRRNPQFSTTEELVDRLTAIEAELEAIL